MTEYSPKVSIVIPVYNGSNYLKDAIDSALAQTYNNIEVIVVNDGSNDNGATERIAKSYGNKIRYYSKENGGVATALNLGISKMTGEYFSWLSHDDLYYEDKIERQIEFLSKLDDKRVFLYSNYSILKGNKITPVIHSHEMLRRKSKYSLLRGCVNGITVLIPKFMFDEFGEFDAKLRCTQDYDYWSRIQSKYDFIHMEEVLSITRLHPKQDSNVSPNVIIEGNILWTKMVESLSDTEKIMYENTLYNFYHEMVKFLETTPYSETLDYCRAVREKLDIEIKNTPIKYKVSVVIPFYNRIDLTIRALKSILAQSYKNLEIILVNDASTDNIDKIQNIVNKNKHVRLVNLSENSGPARARNIGIDQSVGDYIAFLDSDDEFLGKKIEVQLGEMVKYNKNISYTSYTRRDGTEDRIMRDTQLTGLVVPKIIRGASIATPTVVVSRSLLNTYGIRFNEKIRIGEDSCFWLEVAKYSDILLIDQPLTIVNVDSASAAYNSDKTTIGIKNILAYLFTDAYYSTFDDDISWVCDNFHKVNQEIIARKKRLDVAVVSNRVIAMPEFVTKTLPYRAARRLRTDGPRGFARSALKKLNKL